MKRYLSLLRFAFIGAGLVFILKTLFNLVIEVRFEENTFSELFNLNLNNQFEYDLVTTLFLFLIGFILFYTEKNILKKDDSN